MKTNFYEPVVVGLADSETGALPKQGEAVFASLWAAAEWCERQNTSYRPFLPNPANPAVAQVNGRVIRAAHCFNRDMLTTALRAARDGIAIGEPAETAEAVDA